MFRGSNHRDCLIADLRPNLFVEIFLDKFNSLTESRLLLVVCRLSSLSFNNEPQTTHHEHITMIDKSGQAIDR